MDMSELVVIDRPKESLPALPVEAEAVRMLMSKLSLNNYGLPEGYYRSDLLPLIDDINDLGVSPDVLPPDIKVAFQAISFAEGFPTIDGHPFWQQLPHEHYNAAICFQSYLNQSKGIRQLSEVLKDDIVLALPIEITMSDLLHWFHTYCWNIRVRAFDMFRIAHRQRMRVHQAIETEDDHLLMGQRLFSLCCAYLDENEEELKEGLTPKAFTELLKTAAQMQRISVGLPVNGTTGKEANADGQNSGAQTVEVIMRNVAQKTGATVSDASGATDSEDSKRAKFAELMNDPNALALAQELVIKLHIPN